MEFPGQQDKSYAFPERLDHDHRQHQAGCGQSSGSRIHLGRDEEAEPGLS